MNRRSAHTSQVGDALQYFEAAHRGGRGREASNNTARPVPAFKRTASTSSLRGGSSRGYNPAALFSVAAMATAPVGTTVIEDDEEVEEIDEEMVMLTEFSSSAKTDLDQDFDLCDQCTRRRRRARMFQPQQPPASSDTNAAADESVAAEDRQGQGQRPSESDRSLHDNASVTMPLAYRRSDYGSMEHGGNLVSSGERACEGESSTTSSSDSPSLPTHSQGQQQQQPQHLSQQKIPPPRPPRSKVPPVPVSSTNCLKSKSLSDTITGSSSSLTAATASTGLTMASASEKAASTAVFTITPNPISVGATTAAAAAAVSTTEVTLTSASEDAISVKKLPDYCPPAEDTLGMTPAELALIQKRIQLKRILPCIRFEDLESDRGHDESRSLEMVDKRLADVHRDVMRRTENRYLVMEASTFGDKVFTGTLIILTILGILVLFWFRNFGPGLHLLHEAESDRL